MTDRPIIFSSPMVRALIEGRKTQTRRVLNPQPAPDRDLSGCEWRFTFGYKTTKADPPYMEATKPWPSKGEQMAREIVAAGRRVPCRIGDRLWVRERLHRDPDLWKYVADGAEVGWPARRDLANRSRDHMPSIHMPRWASRLTLTVTDVRVQRVQEIGEGDAQAEGVHPTTCANVVAPQDGFPSYRSAFGILWDSLNADRGYGWEENPFVVAISFTVEHRNIDALGVAA